jgi:hypothetical protein
VICLRSHSILARGARIQTPKFLIPKPVFLQGYLCLRAWGCSLVIIYSACLRANNPPKNKRLVLSLSNLNILRSIIKKKKKKS